MKYVLAISGGVDSVVLLDMWAKAHGDDDYIVAHVDHGIRQDSSADARFVAALVQHHGVRYAERRYELGESASESTAREARYDFLFELAAGEGRIIVTAHHADDAIGSVVINVLRGTGWRGLAVHDRPGIERPLLGMRKKDIYEYALRHHLEWVEDATNRDSSILRNALRPSITQLDDSIVEAVLSLRTAQIALKQPIDSEQSKLVEEFGTARYPYAMLEPRTAVELLRQVIFLASGRRPTHFDAEKLYVAMKTFRAGKTLLLADGISVKFTKDEFIVESLPKW